MKRWVIGEADNDLAADIAQKCDLTPLCIKVLLSRGCKDLDDIAAFFDTAPLEDPFVLRDMQEAVDTINKAIESFDLICVYGDYDCDGVTAAAVLYSYLDCCGANVMYYIPEREEGYGLNENAIRTLADKGVKLIVTVDNGISAVNEAQLISELGMELVITDHHQPSETLPNAKAVVDPHRQDCPSDFKNTAGVGVALKLCAALDGGDYDAVMEQYGDLAAIGTIADVVALSGENRTIVTEGLRLLKNTENYGLLCLLERCGLSGTPEISAQSISFVVAPRINAAGRVGSPDTAVQMLLSEDTRAQEKADELIGLNDLRQQKVAEIVSQIKDKIDKDGSVLSQKVIVLDGEGWYHGVTGIVAAKISEAYCKPCVLISADEDGTARGSARSVHGFNIHKCFSYCGELLDRFGGHECAGGLTVRKENIAALKMKIAEYADTVGDMPPFELKADKLLTREDLTVGQISSLSRLEPFGEGSERPSFAIIGARVQKVIPLSQGKHTKLEIAYDSTVQTVLAFGRSPSALGIYQGDMIDMIVYAEVSVYNGQKSISLKLRDIRLHGIDQKKALAALSFYDSFVRGNSIENKLLERMRPDRQELLKVYGHLKAVGEAGMDMLMQRMYLKGMNFAKTRICVDVFCEVGLAELYDGCRAVRIKQINGKADIGSAPTMKKFAAYTTA